MTGKEVIKIMQTHGWNLDRIKGSHHIMIKDGLRSIPVPVHGKLDPAPQSGTSWPHHGPTQTKDRPDRSHLLEDICIFHHGGHRTLMVI